MNKKNEIFDIVQLNTVLPSGESEKDYDYGFIDILDMKYGDKYINPAFDPQSINIIESQKYNSCVNHAGSSGAELEEYKQTGQRIQLSNTFNYLCTREDSHWQGEGMYIREYAEARKKYGTCEAIYFDIASSYEDWKKSGKKPSKEAYNNALNYRIGAFFRIKDVTDEYAIKRAVKQYGYTLISVPVYNTFSKGETPGLIPIPQSEDELLGYHLIVIIGWDEYGRYIFINSWSKNWGKNGLGYLPINYPIREVWIFVDNYIKGKKVPLGFKVISLINTKKENENFRKWVDKYNPLGIDDEMFKGRHIASAGIYSTQEEAKKRMDEVNNLEGIGIFAKTFVLQGILLDEEVVDPEPTPEPTPQPEPTNKKLKIDSFNLIVKEDDEEKVKEFVDKINKKYDFNLGILPIKYKNKYKYFLLQSSATKSEISVMLNKMDNQKPLGYKLRRLSGANLKER